jgi:hypothetical protein
MEDVPRPLPDNLPLTGFLVPPAILELWLPFAASRPIRANHNSKIARRARATPTIAGVARVIRFGRISGRVVTATPW